MNKEHYNKMTICCMCLKHIDKSSSLIPLICLQKNGKYICVQDVYTICHY